MADPDYSAYPQPTDIQQLLALTNLWPSQATDGAKQTALLAEFQIQLNSVKRTIAEKTGWKPFLAEAAPSTRHFDASDGFGFLDLTPQETGIVDVDNNPPTILIDGRTLTLNTDYFLRSSDDAAELWPYDGIQFVSAPYAGQVFALPNKIAITARFGFCSSLPENLWSAIRGEVAAKTLNIMGLTSFQTTVRSRSQEGFSETYDFGPLIADRIKSWSDDFKAAYSPYIRP